jgi:hypothetical protein
VVIEVGGQTITFDQEKVRAIYFGVAPATSVQPAALGDVLKALQSIMRITKEGRGVSPALDSKNPCSIGVPTVEGK